MSVATQFAVEVEPQPYPTPAWASPRRRLSAVPAVPGPAPRAFPPGHVRPVPTTDRGAAVRVLRPPLGDDGAMPLRLTHRGVAVVALAVAVIGMALVWVAARSAAGAPPAQLYRGPAVVTVHAGDTLWSIASRVAPQTDPRSEVAHLQQLNQLRGAALAPGQRLLVR